MMPTSNGSIASSLTIPSLTSSSSSSPTGIASSSSSLPSSAASSKSHHRKLAIGLGTTFGVIAAIALVLLFLSFRRREKLYRQGILGERQARPFDVRNAAAFRPLAQKQQFGGNSENVRGREDREEVMQRQIEELRRQVESLRGISGQGVPVRVELAGPGVVEDAELPPEYFLNARVER